MEASRRGSGGGIEEAAELIADATQVVVLSGAGISTESGIPDFRSPGGLWSRYDPRELTYQRFLASETARRLYWEMAREIYPVLRDALPNEAHRGVVRLDEMGKLRCVITQNIDGLHQKAGLDPSKVIEIHGTALAVVCLSCQRRVGREEIQQRLEAGAVTVPLCDVCGGFLKPATISFGQPMPEEETAAAFEHARSCDLFIVIGSSLVVMPAAQLPVAAAQCGAPLVLVNREPTPVDDLASVVLRGSAGRLMSELMDAVEKRLGSARCG